MELRIINTEEGFLSVRNKWNKIVYRMVDATPFQTWEWNYYWWKDLEENVELYILEAFEGKESYGFAPMIVKNKKIEFIGDKHFDYGMFVVSERKREIVELFIEKINFKVKKERITAFLKCIPQKSSEFCFMDEYKANNRLSCLLWQVPTAGVHLGEYDSFDGYMKAVSGSLRKKAIKPCLKSDLEYEIESFSDEVWSDIEAIYSDRQEDRVGTSDIKWAKPIVKAMSNEQLMKISTLSLREKRVAYLIFFDFNGKRYVWLTAFKKTDNLQLGHFIRYHLIKSSYECQINEVDMMRGAYDYKKQWDCNVFYNYEFILFSNIFQKIYYLAYRRCRKILRDIVYNNRVLKRLYKNHGKR